MSLVVCLGASIVRGQVSSNFVKLLSDRLSGDGFRFVNAGVAGTTAADVLGSAPVQLPRPPDLRR